jgi:hypothetical protein
MITDEIKWESDVYHQLNLWVNEMRHTFQLTIADIVKCSGIGRATLYRILSGRAVSERTRRKLMIAYAQAMVSSRYSQSASVLEQYKIDHDQK